MVGAGLAPSTFILFSVLGTGDASGSHCGTWKEQAQFVAPLLCALLSQGYRLLPLAHILECAATGSWTAGNTIFVVSQEEDAKPAKGPLWQVTSEPIIDLRARTMVVHGISVQWIILERAWFATERQKGSHFMLDVCHIMTLGLEYKHMLNVQDKDVTYLNKGLSAWKARLGMVAMDEGKYVI